MDQGSNNNDRDNNNGDLRKEAEDLAARIDSDMDEVGMNNDGSDFDEGMIKPFVMKALLQMLLRRLDDVENPTSIKQIFKSNAVDREQLERVAAIEKLLPPELGVTVYVDKDPEGLAIHLWGQSTYCTLLADMTSEIYQRFMDLIKESDTVNDEGLRTQVFKRSDDAGQKEDAPVPEIPEKIPTLH